MADNKLSLFQFDSVIRGLLALGIRQDAEISDLANIVHPSTVYRDLLNAFISLKLKQESKQSTHRSLAILGFIGSRNFICGSYLYYLKNNNWPSFGDKKEPNLLELSKRSLQLEEFCVKNSIPGKEYAFNVGFLFDVFDVLHGSELPKGTVEKEWQRGFQAANLVMALAKNIRILSDTAGLFAASTLPAFGSLLKLVPGEINDKLEAGELASYVCRLSGVCSAWESALFFHQKPSLMLGRDAAVRDAAALMHMAYFQTEPKEQAWAKRLKLPQDAWAGALKAQSQARL